MTDQSAALASAGALTPAHVSAKGRIFITQEEGKRNRAYRDIAGVWTIGVGHTSMAGAPIVTAGLVISNAEIDAILARDLIKYENQVKACVHVALNQPQFDALVSFTYNEGEGTLLRLVELSGLNRGRYVTVPAVLEMFVRAGGRDLKDLEDRRKAEADIWRFGSYPVGVTIIHAWRGSSGAVFGASKVAA